MSFIKDQCVAMGRIAVQNQKDMDAYIEALVRIPAPISPPSALNTPAQEAHGAEVLPFVSTNTGD